ncbi:hypothetical protein KIPB_010562, partial [Kipferlia bialata]
LNLSDNSIGDTGATSLSEAVPCLTQLNTLMKDTPDLGALMLELDDSESDQQYRLADLFDAPSPPNGGPIDAEADTASAETLPRGLQGHGVAAYSSLVSSSGRLKSLENSSRLLLSRLPPYPKVGNVTAVETSRCSETLSHCAAPIHTLPRKSFSKLYLSEGQILGSGAFSTVVKATDALTGAVVAAKIESVYNELVLLGLVTLKKANVAHRDLKCWEQGHKNGKYPLRGTACARDVYSAGVIFAQLMSGQSVVDDVVSACLASSDALGRLQELLLDQPFTLDIRENMASSVPGLTDLVNSMTQRNPSDRPPVETLALQVKHMIEQYGDESLSTTLSAMVKANSTRELPGLHVAKTEWALRSSGNSLPDSARIFHSCPEYTGDRCRDSKLTLSVGRE